ncbi:MAG: hypothetical protein DMG86_20670, partial [Acidobacteria bacterium]
MATSTSAGIRLGKISAIVLLSLLSAGICFAQEQEQSPSERPLSTVAREKSPAPEPSVTASPEIAAAKKDEAAKQQPKQTTAPTSLSQPVTLDQAQQLVEQLKQQEKMLIHSYDELERKLAEADSESRRRIFSESLANRDLSL